MYSYNDLIGKKFGKLLVIEKTDQRRDRCVLWLCRCDCGKEKLVMSRSLSGGKARSCGCREGYWKHGLSKTKTYRRAKWAIYSANKKSATANKIDPKKLEAQIREFGGCAYCYEGAYEQLDHFIPLSRGGKHSIENLVPACEHCNKSKHNKMPGLEWWPTKWTNTYSDCGI